MKSKATNKRKSGGMDASIGVNLRVTAHANQGGRKYMEDMFCVAYQPTSDEKDLLYAYFGIFDGHGGREAALYAKTHLMDHIVSQKNFWSDDDELVIRSIREGFISVHHAMWSELERWPRTQSGLPSTSGTTASVAFVRRGKLYIGHVGDSAIVLGYQDPNSKFWKARPLTVDHKPETPTENARIVESGGKVISKSGVPRVVWNRPRLGHKGPVRRSTAIDEIPFLAVARSLGDLWSYNSELDEFVVSPVPDVSVFDIDVNTHRCIILGSDGLWNMLTAQDAVNSVYFAEKSNERQNAEGASPPGSPSKSWINPSKRLVDRALDRWCTNNLRADNTSVVTVVIDPPGPPRVKSPDRTSGTERCSPTRSPIAQTNNHNCSNANPQRVSNQMEAQRASHQSPSPPISQSATASRKRGKVSGNVTSSPSIDQRVPSLISTVPIPKHKSQSAALISSKTSRVLLKMHEPRPSTSRNSVAVEETHQLRSNNLESNQPGVNEPKKDDVQVHEISSSDEASDDEAMNDSVQTVITETPRRKSRTDPKHLQSSFRVASPSPTVTTATEQPKRSCKKTNKAEPPSLSSLSDTEMQNRSGRLRRLPLKAATDLQLGTRANPQIQSPNKRATRGSSPAAVPSPTRPRKHQQPLTDLPIFDIPQTSTTTALPGHKFKQDKKARETSTGSTGTDASELTRKTKSIQKAKEASTRQTRSCVGFVPNPARFENVDVAEAVDGDEPTMPTRARSRSTTQSEKKLSEPVVRVPKKRLLGEEEPLKQKNTECGPSKVARFAGMDNVQSSKIFKSGLVKKESANLKGKINKMPQGKKASKKIGSRKSSETHDDELNDMPERTLRSTALSGIRVTRSMKK